MDDYKQECASAYTITGQMKTLTCKPTLNPIDRSHWITKYWFSKNHKKQLFQRNNGYSSTSIFSQVDSLYHKKGLKVYKIL